MNSTNVIMRLSMSPDPLGWYRRMYLRQMERVSQPRLDPEWTTRRPYGIGRNIQDRSAPQDPRMVGFGGTLRGAKIGSWRENLMVGAHHKAIRSPSLFSWHSSQEVEGFGEASWELDEAPEEV